MKARLKRAEFLSALLLLVVGASLSPERIAADAPGATPCEVMVILGRTEGASIDPALNGLEALKKAPFDAFPQKSLLSRTVVSLEIGKETAVELPNGRKLKLVWLEKAADGRYRVSVSINRPGKQDYLPLLTVVAAPSDPFFVAGQKHEGGTLIIGLRVGKAG